MLWALTCKHTETGFCGFEVDETAFGTYMWPETVGGTSATLMCALNDAIQVTRDCLNGGRWNVPEYGACELLQGSVTIKLAHRDI